MDCFHPMTEISPRDGLITCLLAYTLAYKAGNIIIGLVVAAED